MIKNTPPRHIYIISRLVYMSLLQIERLYRGNPSNVVLVRIVLEGIFLRKRFFFLMRKAAKISFYSKNYYMQPFAADSLLILIPERETCILKNQFHRKLFSAKCISHFSLYFFFFSFSLGNAPGTNEVYFVFL